MDKQFVIHNTFVIEKHYAVTPEKVFAAFADAKQKRKWFAEGDHHTVESYEVDVRTEGSEKLRLRFKAELPVVGGLACANDTRYLEVQPNRLILFASTMRIEGRCISASLGTVELLKAENGTDLIFTHQAAFFEGADGPEMRKQGWEALLEKLGSAL